MATKSTGKGRGGARPGAGRKKLSLSEKETNQLLKAARAKSRDTGDSVWDILMKMVYNPKLRTKDPRAVLAAIKIYSDAVVAKQVHKQVEGEIKTGPVIFLPKQYPTGEDRDMQKYKTEEEVRH